MTAARSVPMWKLFVYSAIGIFAFFVSFPIAGKESILLDHIVTFLKGLAPGLWPSVVVVACIAGAMLPFIEGTWRTSRVVTVFSFLKVVGVVVAAMIALGVGPAWLFEKDMGPFLMETLAVSVGLLVPIGAVFLGFLVGYGLLELVGHLVEPIMRPVFRTPGRSAIDAVASFVGSYSLSLLITNRIYREGGYTAREAAIIATGFSTVSATFMVIVVKAVDLMDHWQVYFWTTLVVTFAVTAIQVRLPPLSRVPDEQRPGTVAPAEVPKRGRLRSGWAEAREVVAAAPPLPVTVWSNLKDGLRMTVAILPTIMSIGLLGLVLAHYTPVFRVLGYLFLPVTWALGIPEPQLVAEASALGVSEMFLPVGLMAGAAPAAAFVVAVVSVSQVIFFSAMVPALMATDIPLSLGNIVLIWVERVVLSLVLVIPIARMLF